VRAVGVVVCLLVAAAAGVLTTAPASGQDTAVLERGERLFVEGCSSCHGAEGEGTDRGPGLADAGEAGAFYYLSTGRMPLANHEEQPRRKEPAYEGEDLDALIAYVASLGDGPQLPDIDGVDVDLAEGGELYRENCQPCHQASGAGGALSYGQAAPQLAPASPLQAAAAMRIGPGEMPVFGDDVLSDEEVAQVSAYVQHLDDPADPGGLPIGRTGPVAEGFVAWFVGVVALLGIISWIGTRSKVGE
jgi:ubiquinol-cytochrome c reductase cytochrome c subunit